MFMELKMHDAALRKNNRSLSKSPTQNYRL